MTEGLSYFELGRKTAAMAKRVLVDGEEIAAMPVERATETSRVVNMETAKALGLPDLEVFSEAVEVK